MLRALIVIALLINAHSAGADPLVRGRLTDGCEQALTAISHEIRYIQNTTTEDVTQLNDEISTNIQNHILNIVAEAPNRFTMTHLTNYILLELHMTALLEKYQPATRTMLRRMSDDGLLQLDGLSRKQLFWRRQNETGAPLGLDIFLKRQIRELISYGQLTVGDDYTLTGEL